MIGGEPVKVGIQYATGGVPAIKQPEHGRLLNRSAALIVIGATSAPKFYAVGLRRRSRNLCGVYLRANHRIGVH